MAIHNRNKISQAQPYRPAFIVYTSLLIPLPPGPSSLLSSLHGSSLSSLARDLTRSTKSSYELREMMYAADDIRERR